jgi:3-deoxy-D-manno-octulosonic-acid transferase
MGWVYLFGVRGYCFLIRLASLWNPKAKRWMQGREMVWEHLDNWQRTENPLYWFHCASLGEFEQGRPLIEALKNHGDCQIVVTFFSPSGYEIRKNYALADLVTYLPRETNKNAARFLAKIKPDQVFFVKYEFWATYIFEAKKQGSRVYSVAAVFRKNQLFFKPYGGFMQSVLHAFDQVFVQDLKSLDLLKTIKVKGILAGDPRYDRVLGNAKNVQAYPAIEAFINGSKVLVVGSSWAADDAVLKDTINHPDFEWKVIIAPHEVSEDRVQDIERIFTKKSVRYSNLANGSSDAQILIIDNVGMLMNVYQYANLAYVGGAFGKGLHNILEPAAFNVCVIFGNKFSKFYEATEFIEAGIGFSVHNADEFSTLFSKLSHEDQSQKVRDFMLARLGATAKILSVISE